MAESLWFSFRPKLPTWGAEGAAADVAWDAESAAPAPSVKAGIGSSLWRMDKMGRWVDPLAYVVNGSSNLHAVWHGVRHLAPRSAHADSAEWDFDLETLDAPLVSPGALMPTGAFNMRRNYSFPGVAARRISLVRILASRGPRMAGTSTCSTTRGTPIVRFDPHLPAQISEIHISHSTLTCSAHARHPVPLADALWSLEDTWRFRWNAELRAADGKSREHA